jgi:hypothetical protein
VRTERPGKGSALRKTAGPEAQPSPPPLVREPLASFDLPFRAQAMAAFSAASCLSRLATASRSMSVMLLASTRSRRTGLRRLRAKPDKKFVDGQAAIPSW